LYARLFEKIISTPALILTGRVYLVENLYSNKHLGGNVYLTVDNNDKTDCSVDISYRRCSPIDHKMYPTPQGLSLTFEQFDKLKDVARELLDLIPDLNTTLPCYMSHQNVEGAIYCGEKKRKLFTQFKILNSLLFIQFISQI
jgi:hypothetical protein